MKITYLKTCTLPRDLVPLLKTRGLLIADEQRAINYLTNIGYFRLSAYLYPLLDTPKENHIYKSEATFNMALDMYRFDRKLRILLFNEIEKIEVAIRSAMNNLISDTLNDVFWMTNAVNFSNHAIFAKTTALIQTEIGKTKEEFIEHFKNKYSNPFPPAWMISEIIPLGVLYNVFNNLKSKSIKKKIAIHFGVPLPTFTSWMLVLSNLRNLCGHHARLWNKEIPIVSHNLNNPTFSWITPAITDMKRVYFRICIIKYLLFTVSPNKSFYRKTEITFSGISYGGYSSYGFSIELGKRTIVEVKQSSLFPPLAPICNRRISNVKNCNYEYKI